MKQLSNKNRKELKSKMAEALNEKMKILSPGMQDILVDDLITAFESRLAVLDKAQSNLHCLVDIGVKIPNETLKA
jgi:hypothetical protein